VSFGGVSDDEEQRGQGKREKGKALWRHGVHGEHHKKVFEVLRVFCVSVVRSLSLPTSWRGGRSVDHGKQHCAVLATKTTGRSISRYEREVSG